MRIYAYLFLLIASRVFCLVEYKGIDETVDYY